VTGDVVEPLPGVAPARRRRPAVGYLLYLAAATLFAINGTVSKSILLTGVESARLSQLRVTAAFLVLVVVVALTRPAALRLRRHEIGLLLAYGMLGVALTQWLYFVAIERLPVGVALLIEFTAPIMVALWARFGMKEPVRNRVWFALALALAGLALVAQVWEGLTLSLLGVAAAFGAAAALAVYYLLGERGVRGEHARDPVSLTMWASARPRCCGASCVPGGRSRGRRWQATSRRSRARPSRPRCGRWRRGWSSSAPSCRSGWSWPPCSTCGPPRPPSWA